MWNLILQCWHLIHRCGRLVCVWKQVFLCGLGRPGMHCVARADLKLLIFLFHSLSGRVIVLFHHAKFNFKRIDSRPNKEGFWGTNSDVQLFGELSQGFERNRDRNLSDWDPISANQLSIMKLMTLITISITFHMLFCSTALSPWYYKFPWAILFHFSGDQFFPL